MQTNIDLLKGKTLTRIEGEVDDGEIRFFRDDGVVVSMYHDQQCCEHVYVEDICGDLNDLVGSEILQACEYDASDDEYPPQDDDRLGIVKEWTFYKFATMKGYVTIRWCGESNGYYSTSVKVKALKNEVSICW